MINLEQILSVYKHDLRREPDGLLRISPVDQPNAIQFWLTGVFEDLTKAELYGLGTEDIKDDSTDEGISEELTLKIMKSILDGTYSLVTRRTLFGTKYLIRFNDENGKEIFSQPVRKKNIPPNGELAYKRI